MKLSTMMNKKVDVGSSGIDFHQLLFGHEHIINDWIILISVRNPWDRLVSTYYQGNIPQSKTRAEPTVKVIGGDFKKWVMDERNPVQCQVDWLKTEHKIFTPDYIIRMESIQEDWDKLPLEFRHDKQNVDKLPKINPSKHKHYTTYYDDELKEYVTKKYSEDIIHFNYKFDNY
tara:strand:- start:324 stop:842 length:519 start_codon:yes stop_codon:yes gene_type:complete